MDNAKVKLTIKAPNQMVDDHLIDCDRNCTIREIKEYLFKDYPTHPKPENQKLIYSGKLLGDELPLSDVLKTYAGTENNTIHLVCSAGSSIRAKTVASRSVQTTTPDLHSQSSVTSNQHYQSSSISNGVSGNNVGDDIFRRNDVSTASSYAGFYMRHMYLQNLTPQQHQNLHEAYVHYIRNHMRLANRLCPANPQEQVESPQNQPANQGVQPNQAEVEEDGVAQRDWLEWMYIMTRLVVLFSVVYFYSSPLRFIVVMTMALLLFNMDVDRWRRRQDNVPNDAQARQNGDGSADLPQEQHQVNEANHPHLLHVIATFISSFFLSLIPEQRDI
uniref:Putative cysteine-responsive endoplasmic reticulum-resident ubiquitin-like domain member 2 protein n=1 Tax=Rhodnius neglectus TaxID=72488 RepID=A0A0P4VMK6_9HEMI